MTTQVRNRTDRFDDYSGDHSGFAAPEPSETVTVVPPMVVTKATTGHIRERATTITLSQNIGYGDLDLNTPAGQSALQGRVKQASQDVCRELDRRYAKPMYTPTQNGACARTAAAQAMSQVVPATRTASR